MKRIVNGQAYDTDKSKVIAKAEYEWELNEENCPCVGTLYQTPGGAFFEFRDIRFTDDHGNADHKHMFEPMTAAQAQKWVLEGDVELWDEDFIAVPEAAAETAEPQATIYVRAPAALKRQVDIAAKDANLSLNAYVLRALEQALQEINAALG